MSEHKIDVMWDDTPVDVSTEVNFIWSIANKLRGTYQSDKYKDVIIPMVIIRRFECALDSTKQAVVDKYKENPAYPAKAMCRVSGFQFFNTSEYTLAELVNDPDHLAANFRNYIEGFSANVQDIIKSLDFDKQIDKMDKNNRLLSVVKAFSELDLDPKTIDNVKMGYIFEDLIRRFSENAEAGDHYTGRDIIKLMVNILLAEGCDDIFDDHKEITILDQAAGTGGMLSTSYNFIHRYNPTAKVRLFGQEINPESYAMCVAEMLIKGQNAENIRMQDTMKADCFPDRQMRFVIENPPFGTPWGGKDAAEGVEQAVKEEKQKGFDKVYLSPAEFMPVLTKILSTATTDKKLLDKIADGLSVMDKSAEIQRDKKGNIIYDKETKDTEIVKFDESIEDYMAREVLPHVPDAQWFFEEDLGKKNPVLKTGAEIPFTRYFYKYQQPKPSEELEQRFLELEKSVSERIARLFG